MNKQLYLLSLKYISASYGLSISSHIINTQTGDSSYHFFLESSCDQICLKGVIFIFIFLCEEQILLLKQSRHTV